MLDQFSNLFLYFDGVSIGYKISNGKIQMKHPLLIFAVDLVKIFGMLCLQPEKPQVNGLPDQLITVLKYYTELVKCLRVDGINLLQS